MPLHYFTDRRPLKKAIKLDNGFLRIPLTAAKEAVLTYYMEDGSSYNALRPLEELKKASKNLSMLVVTNEHPPLDEMPLNPENVKKYQVGHIADTVEVVQDELQTSALITDKDTISQIEAGKREISCGYFCILEDTKGVFNGIPYDVIQRDIQHDHVAIVEEGRAGPEVSLHYDASSYKNNTYFKGKKMPSIQKEEKEDKKVFIRLHLDGKDIELPEKNADDVKKIFDSMQERLEKTKAKIDTLELELEKAKNLDNLKNLVKARVELEKIGSLFLDSKEDISNLEDNEIRKKVILKAFPSLDEKLKNASEAYLDASYDLALDSLSRETEKTKFNFAQPRVGGATIDNSDFFQESKKAREEMLARYNRPLTKKEGV